jgi:hypothetical protein
VDRIKITLLFEQPFDLALLTTTTTLSAASNGYKQWIQTMDTNNGYKQWIQTQETPRLDIQKW